MEHESDGLHQEDLAWARALATGDRSSLDRYERELVPMIAAQLHRRGITEDAIADLQQTLRARLFVGDGAGPSIASYEGRGPLRAWVLVSALRESVRVKQRETREPAVSDEALYALADRTAPAMPAFDKERYRDVFRAAFRTALAELAPRDRNLLRMHVIDGLTIDQIGGVQGVHRTTAARWIERARETVSRGVRRELMATLGTDPFEADELLRWAQSRIELSLSGLAADTPSP
ncbi:MAG: sigma-70 family RNA polymerase sigma factor [Kofleriaceae bacterium]